MFPVADKVMEEIASRRRQFPCRSNRASVIGHPCERYLVYMRTRWEEAKLHEPELESIFEGGRMIEDMQLDRLKKAGFNVTQQQRDFEMKEQGITGHVDAFVGMNGNSGVPIEIKGIQHFDWDKINTAEDMIKSEKMWFKKYPAQLQLYLLMSNKEEGLFLMVSKSTYVPKDIWMKLDYDYCESLLKKAERINKHVAEKTLPKATDCEASMCSKCEYAHICLPDVIQKEFEVVDEPEFEEMLNRREILAPYSKEYKKLDEEVKASLKGVEKRIIGKWMITGKESIRQVKAKEASEQKIWTTKIVKMDEVLAGS